MEIALFVFFENEAALLRPLLEGRIHAALRTENDYEND
jgi:hypothetical protein